MPEIQRVSIRHEAIMDHLMSFPCVRLGDVAKTFGVSQAWLSCIIHSDAFQGLLKEKQGVAFHHTVLPLKEKMLAVAHQALDQLTETLPLETEPKALSAIAGDVLDRLGYGSKNPVVQFNQQNNIHVSDLRQEIEAAQALLGRGPPPLEVAHNGDRATLALPGANGKIPGNGISGLGVPVEGAAVPVTPSEEPSGAARGAVREESALEAGRVI